MRSLILLLACALSSCALFTDDATPALEISLEREGILVRQSDAFAQFITAAKGLDEGKRATYLAAIAKDKGDYLALAKAGNDWLGKLGTVTVDSLLLRGWKLYREVQ